MYNIFYGLIDLFRKSQPKVTSTTFKTLEHNDVQLLLFQALKRVGLKPIITCLIYPKFNGKDVSINEVYLNNGCQVTVQLSNPNNSLLTIYIFGKQNIITVYKDKMNKASQLLLEEFGIVLEVFQHDFTHHPCQLTINQYISNIVDIPSLIKETLTPLVRK